MMNAVLEPTSYFLNWNALPVFSIGIMIVLLGTAILLKEGIYKVSAAFFSLTLATFFWLVGIALAYCSKGEITALFWNRFEHLGVTFIPSFVFIFSLCVTGKFERFKYLAWLGLALSGISFISILASNNFITGFYHYAWGYYAKYGYLSIPFLIYFFLMMLASMALYAHEIHNTQSKKDKGRLKYFFAAFSLAYLASVDFIPTYGLAIYPLGYLAIFAFLVLSGIAIWKYRLVEITPAFAAEKIMECMADYLVVVDKDGIVRLVNKALCKFYGNNEKFYLGNNLFNVLPGFINKKKLSELVSGEKISDEFETYVSVDAQPAETLSVSASVIKNNRNEVDAVIFLARNITQRKFFEIQFRQYQQTEALAALVGGLAKDLNDQLTPLKDTLDRSIQGVKSSDPVFPMLYEAERYTEKSYAVMRKLISFSQASMNDKMLLSTKKILDDLETWLPKFLPVSIMAHVSCDKDVRNIFARETEVESVLINLIFNAKEAMPHGGRLIIKAGNVHVDNVAASSKQHPGDYVLISVRDTGTGMTPEVLMHIFEPFFTTKRKSAASGLGLSMAQNIVNDYGGWVEVSSQPGKGSTFSVFFPVSQTDVSIESSKPQV